MKTKTLLILIFTGLIILPFGICSLQAQGDGEYHDMYITVDDLDRYYLLYEPEGHSGGDPWPLVIVYHGAWRNPAFENLRTKFYAIADTAKFLCAFPEGLIVEDTVFNQTCPGWYVPGDYIAEQDDVAFTDAIINELIAHPDFAIDTNRIHASGISAGGFFALYLGCALPNKIGSIANIASSMSYYMLDNLCPPERPVSVLHMIGTEDEYFPEEGDNHYLPIEVTAEYWASIDNCNEIPAETELPDIDPNDGSTVTLFDYEDCDYGFEVLYYRINGGGHCYPGAPDPPCNNDINASAEIWKFFKRNPHPDAFSCLANGITFSSQAEIDNFRNQYPFCIEIQGDMVISGNDIENLNGLMGITTIGGGLEIHSNEDLEDLAGLDSLAYINGDLKVYNNADLESFAGLGNLEHIGADFSVSINNELNDLTSLENLSYVGEDITIISNESLTELTGLDNIDTSSFQELTIKNNVNLSYCSVNSICEFISDPAHQQDIDIRNNAPGCNNEDEVEMECVNAITVFEQVMHVSVNPNPFIANTNIEFKLERPGFIRLTIYNKMGKQIHVIASEFLNKGNYSISWNSHNLPSGVYFCVLKTEEALRTIKMIKLN